MHNPITNNSPAHLRRMGWITILAFSIKGIFTSALVIVTMLTIAD